MKWHLLYLSLLACACTYRVVKNESPDRWPTETYAPSIFGDIPSRVAFLGWKNLDAYVSNKTPSDSLRKVSLNCDKKVLYPTHPSQIMKTYHVFKVGQYDHFKLLAEDEACKLGVKKPNSAGKKTCLVADTIEYAIVSDVYEDACGHLYRGYHESMFLKKNETMGSLFSIGRATYQNPKSEFENDMLDGGTYPVALKEFLFLTDVFPGEAEKALELKEKALAAGTHTYDVTSRTFVMEQP